MKTVTGAERRESAPPSAVPLLVNGDRMKQPEFHRRYREHTDRIKIELIGGIVYVNPPLRWPHRVYHEELGFTLGIYRRATPGVELGPDATTILGEESEPRPDLTLRVLTECGGQSRVNDEGYIEGPPELLAEVAYSSRAIDLNQKRVDYEKAGVLEYLVLSIEDEQLFWFHFPSGATIKANRQGVYRSTVFPGLWIHEQALLGRDSARLQKFLQQGLKSKPHAAFVKRLERARRRNS
jgi:Uma2 family endonuclease